MQRLTGAFRQVAQRMAASGEASWRLAPRPRTPTPTSALLRTIVDETSDALRLRPTVRGLQRVDFFGFFLRDRDPPRLTTVSR